ncbi:phosphatidylinositol phosphatase PTPRQ isoform X1 [Myzus persicae]|uniref:phosphatidylinositol phosphatase PTPRQ isoform X1 n=1 Tax=Myzus persicae TaxID=13164 RepID=UPI000B938116|nr:phosphatidylinositol phosphatase PTPRQ isoform X1 [Myzus persicae]
MNLFNNYFRTSFTLLTVYVTVASTLRQPEDFPRRVIKLTIDPISPTAFYAEWRLLPDVEGSVNYSLMYSTQLSTEVKLTNGNNLTLTGLIECAAYIITVRCSYYVAGENVFGGLFTSTVATTSHIFQLKAVRNLTLVISSHSILISWENPVEQKLCTATFHVSLTSIRDTGQEIQTEFDHHMMTALEPCVTYFGYVSAVDFSGVKGSPTAFNVTTDTGIPGSVVKLTALSNSSRTISVRWDKPTNSSFCFSQYVIVYCYDIFVCSTIITETNSLTISHLMPCVTYQITVTPKMTDTENGFSAKTQATVIAEVLEKPLNGRILFLTSHNVTLQWDHPIDPVCNLIHQIVNCSYLNSSLEMMVYTPAQAVTIDNLKPFTKYICNSAFFNKQGYSEKSDDIIFWTKLPVPDPPTNLSILKLSANSVVLAWAAPTTISPDAIKYRWTVTFKNFLYELPNHCAPQTAESVVTYFVKNDQTYQYQVVNLMPASCYLVELNAATESGLGNSTNITIHTLSSTSSSVKNLQVTSIEFNLVVLSWKYPCMPNGKIAFFHSTLVGERLGFHNHIFSIKCDISDNETEFEYSLTQLLPEYTYVCTVVAITDSVENPGQDKRIRFITPSTSPDLPNKYDTYRNLRVTVSDSHLTQVRLSIPGDLFTSSSGNIQYYSIIVYQDGGFPDKPEHGNRLNNPRQQMDNDVWPPVMRTWAEAAPYPFILAYQTTPDRWMPFKDQNDGVFDIGADDTCSIHDQKSYCNGPLRPVTNYRLKLRAFTADGFQDSWTVPFTTRGKPTAVYYLVLYSVLFAVLITATGMYCILNEKVPWAVQYRVIHPTATRQDPGLPSDMNFKHLSAKTPQEIEAEYDLLNVYSKSNFTTDAAMMPQNKFKNRYINTLPYDYNRVIIRSGDTDDYINASFIEDSKGYRQYIACQGPMKNTCVDMWQMVLDQDVASIVMLCQISEKDKIKCYKYFPNSNEKLVFGDIQVKNDITIVDKGRYSFTIRILTVLKGHLKKTIRHFQFHDWPDFGTPNDPSILLQFWRVVQAKSSNGLVVVHCSAGVGRTGTYIACDMLLRLIHQDRSKLNVFKTVLRLREQRTNMVQTQAQYEFVYEFLAYCLNLQTNSLNKATAEDNPEHVSPTSPTNSKDECGTKLIQT